jgi:acyl-coenzyme A thioesterase PaaI-like protein
MSCTAVQLASSSTCQPPQHYVPWPGLDSYVPPLLTVTRMLTRCSAVKWEFMGGVTRSLNISYLKAVPIGTKVRLSSRVVGVGKQMAMIRGDMKSLDGKTVYCTVEHHKVNVPILAEHAKVRVPWDDAFEKEWKTETGAKSKI